MIKYINGKVEIWFSDLPPTNINSIWMYKNVTGGDPDDYVYDFRVYNRHKDLWETMVDAETYEMVDQYPTINDFPDVGDPIPPSETKLYIDQEFKNAYFYSNGNYYKIVQDSPDYMNTDGSNSNVKTFVFDTTVDEDTGLSAGMMRWSQDDGTLNLGMNGGGVEQSIGLELYYRVTANAQITNGRLVAAAGTHGNSGTILASHAGPGIDPRYILGVATQNINAGERGFVTWFGKIRHIKTDGNGRGEVWVNGDLLYQSPTHVGELTKTQPTAPYNKAPIAIIISAHATNGAMFVRIQRSLKLDNINDVDITSATEGQPLVKQSDGVWKGSDTIQVNEIIPRTDSVKILNLETSIGSIADLFSLNIKASNYVESAHFIIPFKGDDEIITAGGGTIPIQTLKQGIYQLYNPANETQVILEINAAGQVLINGDIIHNGSAYETHAQNINTPQQHITLREGAIAGLSANELAGFIIKNYDGLNDGLIAIDNNGELMIGDDGALQPVLTREPLGTSVDYSPLFLNKSTYRAETLPGTTVKNTVVDNDAVMIKDSADSNKPKWWTFANIKANLKGYFDTLYVTLTGNQTISGIKTFNSSPLVPTGLPGENTKAASIEYVDTAMTVLFTDNIDGGVPSSRYGGTVPLDFGKEIL